MRHSRLSTFTPTYSICWSQNKMLTVLFRLFNSMPPRPQESMLYELLLLLNEVLTCTKERQVKRTCNTCPDECVYGVYPLHMSSVWTSLRHTCCRFPWNSSWGYEMFGDIKQVLKASLPIQTTTEIEAVTDSVSRRAVKKLITSELSGFVCSEVCRLSHLMNNTVTHSLLLSSQVRGVCP